MPVSKNWSNLRSFLRKSYNREVNEWFADEPDPVPDNSTSRKNAKRACLLLPKETQNTALLKTLTFRFVVQRTHLRPHVYGTPIGTLDTRRKYRPQIFLYFLEDEEDLTAENAGNRTQGEITYRLMNETSESISQTELISIANKIKLQFGAGNGFLWRKGKDLASYTDKDNGYQFQLLVRSKTDAKELITKLLETNSDTPSWQYLSYKEADDPDVSYPNVSGTQRILGKTKKKPRVRPVVSVRFRTAYCNLWGLSTPIVLYDKSFRFLDALVED